MGISRSRNLINTGRETCPHFKIACGIKSHRQATQGGTKMFEYEIENKATGEIYHVYGYSWKDACRRRKLIPEEWYIRNKIYVD